MVFLPVFPQGEEIASINPDNPEAEGIVLDDEEPDEPEPAEYQAAVQDGEQVQGESDADAQLAGSEGGEGEEGQDEDDKRTPVEEDEETKAAKAAAAAEAAAAAAQAAAANQRPLAERFPLKRRVRGFDVQQSVRAPWASAMHIHLCCLLAGCYIMLVVDMLSAL